MTPDEEAGFMPAFLIYVLSIRKYNEALVASLQRSTFGGTLVLQQVIQKKSKSQNVLPFEFNE
jgi:hypothetical protein